MRILPIAALLLCPTLPALSAQAQTSTSKPAKPAQASKSGASAARPATRATAPLDPATLWRTVSATAPVTQLSASQLSPGQIEDVQALLLNRTEADGWGCEDDVPPNDWLKDLTYFEISLAPKVRTLFIQAGHACGHTDHDVNGAMWILRPPTTANGDLTLIATPEDSFNGALYSIQPTASHGYPDLVVTWVVNPTESDLTYFRYDGRRYQAIGIAKRLTETGTPRIEPTPIPKEK